MLFLRGARTSVTLARRGILAGAVGAKVAMCLAPKWLEAHSDTEDPRVAEVLFYTIGIDMHNHVTQAGERPGSDRKKQPKSHLNIDPAEKIKRVGLTAVLAAFRLGFNASEPAAKFLQVLTAVDGLLRAINPVSTFYFDGQTSCHMSGRPVNLPVSPFWHDRHDVNHVWAIHDAEVIRTTDCSSRRRFHRAGDARARAAREGRSGLRSWLTLEDPARFRGGVGTSRRSFPGFEHAPIDPGRADPSAVLGAELLRQGSFGAECACPSPPRNRRAVAARLSLPGN